MALHASKPNTCTRPKSARTWPVARPSSVLLHAPLAPTTPVMPGRSSNVTWLTPITGPYHFETCSNRTDGEMTGCARATRGDPGVPWIGAAITLSDTLLMLRPLRRPILLYDVH